MKKILSILIFIIASVTVVAQAPPAGCCPDFRLVTNNVEPCDSNACKEQHGPIGGQPPNGATARIEMACKNQAQTYYIAPAIPGFTYSWTVVGGTPATASGTPVTINWGSGSTGYIQVLIKNADSTCRDTIRMKVCLLDGPTAGITFSPATICINTPINFSGITSVGANTYSWDFGDGTYSDLQIPLPHIYTTPGIKTVILKVSTTKIVNGREVVCGCSDTAMLTINVLNKSGMDIYTDNCKKMLCPGDTVTYCTSATACSGLVWTVNGGTIIGSSTGTCVKVAWDQPSITPTTVTVTASSCPSSICGNTATINVPVLYPNIAIDGPNPVCPNSVTSYSLPALPGTFYKWTLSGGGVIMGPDSNHNVISINWNNLPNTGPYTLTCNYNNPYSGCSGSSSKLIYIKPKFELFGLSPACVGQQLMYCANGPVATWTYFPAVGFSAVAVGASCQNITWNTAGNYTITAVPVTPSNYCSSPAVLNVVVIDTPTVNSMVGPLVVCAGQNVVYSISSNMNAGTFNWTISNGTIVQFMGAHKDSVLVTFTSNGTISVSQTVNGCSSYTQTINVSVISSIGTPTGPSPVCIDQTATYTIAGPVPSGGYTWTLSNALGTIISQTGNSVTIQWSGGAPTATCVLTAAACTATSVLTITVNNPPNGTITATGDLCSTGVTLTTSLSMPTYSWFRNGLPHATTAVNNINVILPGYYTVKSLTPCYGKAAIFVPNTFTSTVSISANSYTQYCIGDVINFNLIATLVSNNTCTYSYQWYNGASPVGTNSPTYNVIAPGSYTVVISCGNCKDTSNVIVVSQVPCSPGCDNALNYIPDRQIGNDIGGPSVVDITAPPLTYTLSINPPVASPCNVVTFSADYYFDLSNTPSSGVFWNFGDGYGTTSPWSGLIGTSTTSPHTYTTPGIYVVTAWMYSNCINPNPPPDSIICRRKDTIHYVVPIAANFGANVNCNVITLSNLSTTLPSLGCTISTYAWSYTGPGGATFNNSAIANPVLTTIAPGTYNITLTVTSTCGGCSATISYPVIITTPSAAFSAPATVCAGTAVPFTTSSVADSYNWNFGNGYQSNLQTTTHAFAPPPPTSSLVTLTVTDVMGCTATASQTINILPPLTVTIPSSQFICPGGSYTITAPTGFSNYQWYFNGNIIPLANSSTYVASAVGEYYVAVDMLPTSWCKAKSNKFKLWHHPKPIAKIMGETIQCLGITGGGTLIVQNSISDPNYTYSWSVSPAATFVPNNTVFNPTVTVTGPGTYRFILTVTDNITKCIAKDTFCVWAYNSPQVTIGGGGNLCEGTAHTFTVTGPLAGHVYRWSNGVMGTSMTTGLAGTYFVNVLNPATGCTGTSNSVMIKKRPYVALFPIGCDTLCDTAKIIPPLPLGPGQTYNGVYNIDWYVDGVFNSTGPSLSLNTLSLGNHTIEIVVNFLGDTCKSRSGKFLIFVKNCKCDCKESKWDKITITKGKTEGDPAGNPKEDPTQFNNNNNTGTITLQCKSQEVYKLDCNKPYTLNAGYNCKDTACNGKVKFKLQPPTGPAITGSVPPGYTFTPTQSGIYTLTVYGLCGDVVCDSCVIKFEVKCVNCDCKGSKWDKIILTKVKTGELPGDGGDDHPSVAKNTTTNPSPGSQTAISLNCNKTYKLECKQTYSINTNYFCKDSICNQKVTYSLQGPTGGPITGSIPAPLNFTPTQSGTYVLTMYGWCGDKICDSCIIKFEVECEPICDCKGSKWGEQTVTIGSSTQKFNCGKTFDVKCKQPVTVNANYLCADQKCNQAVTYTLLDPNGGSSTGNLPLTFTPSITGTYTLTMNGYCGTTLCATCVITFKTDCPPPPCCPYEIKGEAGTVKYDYNQIPNATVAAQTFTINGLSTANITEVRANVVSYTIDDNYKKECMKCVNLPFTWASINSATNIGAAPPKITMYGGTNVPTFTGSGAGAYQNPREVIWNNGSQINIPNGTNIGINFILPPVPAIDCCELKGKVCVKFTFRDAECKECEVIICFDFVIKKK